MMGRRFLQCCSVFLLLAAAATPARSRSFAATPATLSATNAIVQPGDTIRLADGVYTTAPSPARSGLPGARIVYIGNVYHRNRVQVPGATFNVSDVAWYGMRFTSSVAFAPSSANGWKAPARNRIEGAQVLGSVALRAATNCALWFVHVGNDTVAAQFSIQSNEANAAVRSSRWDTVAFCTMKLRTPASSCGLLFEIKGLDFGDRVDDHLFLRNLIEMVSLPANGSECQPVGIYRMSRSWFEGNIWRHWDSGSGTDRNHRAWRLRDESWDNKFIGDKFYTLNRGSTPTWIELTDSGANRGHGGRNKWYRCKFTHAGTAWSDYGPIAAQNGFNSDTLLACQFTAANGAGHGVLNVHGPVTGATLIADNIFVSGSGVGLKMWTGNGTAVIRGNTTIPMPRKKGPLP